MPHCLLSVLISKAFPFSILKEINGNFWKTRLQAELDWELISAENLSAGEKVWQRLITTK